MMTYGYSATKNAFYLMDDEKSYQLHGTWHEDIIQVSNKTWAEFSSSPPPGKVRGADEHKQPCWIDAPVATQEQTLMVIKEKRASLMEFAVSEISKLNIVRSVYELTEDESSALNLWEKYFSDLYRMNTGSPKGIIWPIMPKEIQY